MLILGLSMIRSLVCLILLVGGSASAQDLGRFTAPEYVAHCAVALDQGDVGGFEGLQVETEVTNDTTFIRGWRGKIHAGFVVSLIRRGGLGMCDVAFSPSENDAELMAQIASGARVYLAELLSDPANASDPDGMGRAILTCVDGAPVSVFVDSENLDQGLNVQIALVRSKLGCSP